MEFLLLVSTYVVCERLSVMQRLPESDKAKFVLKFLTAPLFWNLVKLYISVRGSHSVAPAITGYTNDAHHNI